MHTHTYTHAVGPAMRDSVWELLGGSGWQDDTPLFYIEVPHICNTQIHTDTHIYTISTHTCTYTHTHTGGEGEPDQVL